MPPQAFNVPPPPVGGGGGGGFSQPNFNAGGPNQGNQGSWNQQPPSNQGFGQQGAKDGGEFIFVERIIVYL